MGSIEIDSFESDKELEGNHNVLIASISEFINYKTNIKMKMSAEHNGIYEILVYTTSKNLVTQVWQIEKIDWSDLRNEDHKYLGHSIGNRIDKCFDRLVRELLNQ